MYSLRVALVSNQWNDVTLHAYVRIHVSLIGCSTSLSSSRNSWSFFSTPRKMGAKCLYSRK